jgi:hypoxanthine phosphoribosyltransferase
MEGGNFFTDTIVQIVAGFIGSVLAGLFMYWIAKKGNIWISRLVKWQVDYFRQIEISLFVISLWLIFIGIAYFENPRWLVAGPGILLFIPIGLCSFIKRNSVILSRKEIDNEKTITPKDIHPQASKKQISVYRIKPMNDDGSISWYAFGQGIEIIKKQLITIRGSAIVPDIIFGVNTPGYTIAQCVGRFLGVKEVELIRTTPLDAKNERVFNIGDQAKYNVRCIIIVDGKLKTGKSIKKIYDDLDKIYPNADIIYIAFIGFVDPSDKLSLEDFGKKELKHIKYKPDCIAFYAEKKPVNFPYEIR